MVLLPLVTRFLAAHPAVNVEIVVNDALVDMVSENFDAGVRFGSGRLYDWEFEKGGVELKIAVTGPLILGDTGLMAQAALQGAGIAFAFESQVADLVAARRLVRVLEDWCPYYSGFYLYYPGRRQVPAALRAFIDFVKQEAT